MAVSSSPGRHLTGIIRQSARQIRSSQITHQIKSNQITWHSDRAGGQIRELEPMVCEHSTLHVYDTFIKRQLASKQLTLCSHVVSISSRPPLDLSVPKPLYSTEWKGPLPVEANRSLLADVGLSLASRTGLATSPPKRLFGRQRAQFPNNYPKRIFYTSTCTFSKKPRPVLIVVWIFQV